jgi:hypothetical protein
LTSKDISFSEQSYSELQCNLGHKQMERYLAKEVSGSVPSAFNRVSICGFTFPEPSRPHISDNSPSGNLRLRSARTNACRGVEAIDAALLPVVRSFGQVTVQDWKATVRGCSRRGNTFVTSTPERYFSIRRRETKVCPNQSLHRERETKYIPEEDSQLSLEWYSLRT